MKLFKDSRGFVIAFGFDMVNRKPDASMISWCDPETMSWESTVTNMAGWNHFPFAVVPEFVFQSCSGDVVAYQPGRCIEMTFIGPPIVWHFRSPLAQVG